MSKTVLTGTRLFDGLSDTLAGPAEILIENGVIADIGVLASGKQADTVAMAGDPVADIAAEKVDLLGRHRDQFIAALTVCVVERYACQ